MVKTRKRGVDDAVDGNEKKVAEIDLNQPSNGKQTKSKNSASGKKKRYDAEKKVKGVSKLKAKGTSKLAKPAESENEDFVETESNSSEAEIKCKEGTNVTSYMVRGGAVAGESDGEITEDDESLTESDSELDTEVEFAESQNSNAAKKKGKSLGKPVESDEELLDYIDDIDDQDKRGRENEQFLEPMVQMTDEEDDEEEKNLARRLRALRKQKKLARERKVKQKIKPKTTFAMVEEFCTKNGLVIQKPTFQRKSILQPALPDKGATRGKLPLLKRKSNVHTAPEIYGSPSEATIYKCAVDRVNDRNKNRVSNQKKLDIEVENFLKRQRYQRSPSKQNDEGIYVNTHLSRRLFTGCNISDRPAPSTSKQGGGDREMAIGRHHQMDNYYQEAGEEQARDLIKEGEQSKARILELPGESMGRQGISNYGPITQGRFNPGRDFDYKQQFIHSAMVDEQYSMVATHVDETLYNKVTNGEYVDFSKLIPRDRVWEEDNQTLELVQRGGKAVFAPSSDRETTAITNFNKWEQAFRVFSAIFTKEHPERSSELVQYNHLIYTTAQTYVWSNVYAYDKDFRIHLSHNPSRTWSLILQQAWSFRLKTKLAEIGHSNGGRTHEKFKGKREVCYRFNRGKCSYGPKCKFEHRCQVCTKYGHGAWNCRKALSGGNGNNSAGNSGSNAKDAIEVASKKVKNE